MPSIQEIPLLKKGDTRTLMQTEVANQLISNVNKILKARVIFDPSTMQSQSGFRVSEQDAVFVVGTKQQ